MADLSPIERPWRLILPQGLYAKLHDHLFPGDGDEHGAVVLAGLAESTEGVHLLAREVRLAADGVDYVPSKRGYRMLKADFIATQIAACCDERLVYLAVHNHSGSDSVAFSADDLRSHERGYPALLDIAAGMPVGALVFAPNAVAGDIWLPGDACHRVALRDALVVGASRRRLEPSPPRTAPKAYSRYDRQARLFGDAGQDILRQTKVGIIGLGGAGSLLAEYLGRLGVGRFVLADPDRVDVTNLPRLTAAVHIDAMLPWSQSEWSWLRRIASRLARPKVALARRNILRANPEAQVAAMFGDFLDAHVAAQFVDCDYLFLAADTMRARLLFNAIVHQYLIPGVQVGAKVEVDSDSGEVLDAFSVDRPVTSESGCLLCNRLINAAKLQQESISAEDRQRQRYIDEPEVVVPSVITLNAMAASQAANDFLFYMTGLRAPAATGAYRRFQPMQRYACLDEPRRSPTCPECGTGPASRLARGDARRLPVIGTPAQATRRR